MVPETQAVQTKVAVLGPSFCIVIMAKISNRSSQIISNSTEGLCVVLVCTKDRENIFHGSDDPSGAMSEDQG